MKRKHKQHMQQGSKKLKLLIWANFEIHNQHSYIECGFGLRL